MAKLRFWSMKPADFIGRATRMASGVALASFLGFYFLDYARAHSNKVAHELSNAFKWAAITCVVVTAPVTGRAAQTGVQRMLGTVVGGLLGFVVFQGADHFGLVDNVMFMTAIAAFMACLGCYLGWLFQLDISAKLFSLTYLLVVFGAQTDGDAAVLAETRIGGICLGVVISLALSVVIFPQSATDKAITQLKEALKCLSDLNHLAWCHAELATDPAAIQKALKRSATSPALDVQANGSNGLGTPEKVGDGDDLRQPLLKGSQEEPEASSKGVPALLRKGEQLEKKAEQCLAKVYKKLDNCEKQLPLAKNEVGMSRVLGVWCFLPACASCNCGGWRLPKKELQKVVVSVRRVARLLWTLHITFSEGFDENMSAVLAQEYPQQLFPQLIAFSKALVQELHDSFPTCSSMSTVALDSFCVAVEGLIRVSDYQRRRIIKTIKRFKRQAIWRRMQAGSTPGGPTDSPEIDATLAATLNLGWDSVSDLASPERPYAPQGGSLRQQALCSDSDGDFPGGHLPFRPPPPNAFGQPHPYPNGDCNGCAVPGTTPSGHAAIHQLLEGISREAPPQGRADTNAEAHAGEHAVGPDIAELAARLSERPELARMVLQLADQLRRCNQGSSSNPMPINMRRTSGEYAGSPSSMSDLGSSPSAVLANLPPGLVISTTQSFTDTHRSYVPAAEPPSGRPLIRCELPHGDTLHLEMFPETAEGHVAKVRWYSFQFLMEELRDEFRTLHKALGALIAKLPHAQQHDTDNHNDEHSSEAGSDSGAVV